MSPEEQPIKALSCLLSIILSLLGSKLSFYFVTSAALGVKIEDNRLRYQISGVIATWYLWFRGRCYFQAFFNESQYSLVRERELLRFFFQSYCFCKEIIIILVVVRIRAALDNYAHQAFIYEIIQSKHPCRGIDFKLLHNIVHIQSVICNKKALEASNIIVLAVLCY